jgi:hypothetical protein
MSADRLLTRAITAIGARILRSRTLMRAPIWIYRARLGFLFGSRMLMLEHIGRKTGLPRQVVLEVIDHPTPDTYVVPPDSAIAPSGSATCRRTPASACMPPGARRPRRPRESSAGRKPITRCRPTGTGTPARGPTSKPLSRRRSVAASTPRTPNSRWSNCGSTIRVPDAPARVHAPRRQTYDKLTMFTHPSLPGAFVGYEGSGGRCPGFCRDGPARTARTPER